MIFNKSNTGAGEIKDLLGFVYRSISFANLTTYLEMGEREVIRVIGKLQFNQALDHYLSNDYQAEPQIPQPEIPILDALVRKVQLVAALHAYRRYVQSNDVTHSEKGRQIFVSESEKPAFEWQIEKDNENLLQLAHEATDILLEYLDEYIDWSIPVGQGQEAFPPLLVWGSSPERLAQKALLIDSASAFDQVFPIGGSRYTFMALVPFIARVQGLEIKSCFTDTAFQELISQHQTGTLSDRNKAILERVRQPLALLSLSIAVKRLSSAVLPSGIFQDMTVNVVRGKSPAGKIDRNELQSSLEKDGNRELVRLQEYLRKLGLQDAGDDYSFTTPSESIDDTLLFVRV